MDCPISRGGCGKRLAWDDGAFCKSCMAKAQLLLEGTKAPADRRRKEDEMGEKELWMAIVDDEETTNMVVYVVADYFADAFYKLEELRKKGKIDRIKSIEYVDGRVLL